MATEFNSFDASKLGAFTRSALGARNGSAYSRLVVLAVSRSGYPYQTNGDQYRDDYQRWNRDYAPKGVGIMIAQMPDYHLTDLRSSAAVPVYTDLVPNNSLMPDRVAFRQQGLIPTPLGTAPFTIGIESNFGEFLRNNRTNSAMGMEETTPVIAMVEAFRGQLVEIFLQPHVWFESSMQTWIDPAPIVQVGGSRNTESWFSVYQVAPPATYENSVGFMYREFADLPPWRGWLGAVMDVLDDVGRAPPP